MFQLFGGLAKNHVVVRSMTPGYLGDQKLNNKNTADRETDRLDSEAKYIQNRHVPLDYGVFSSAIRGRVFGTI